MVYEPATGMAQLSYYTMKGWMDSSKVGEFVELRCGWARLLQSCAIRTKRAVLMEENH